MLDVEGRRALAMIDPLGVEAPGSHAALTALDECVARGLQDHDVGARLELREDQSDVTVRLPTAAA